MAIIRSCDNCGFTDLERYFAHGTAEGDEHSVCPICEREHCGESNDVVPALRRQLLNERLLRWDMEHAIRDALCVMRFDIPEHGGPKCHAEIRQLEAVLEKAKKVARS